MMFKMRVLLWIAFCLKLVNSLPPQITQVHDDFVSIITVDDTPVDDEYEASNVVKRNANDAPSLIRNQPDSRPVVPFDSKSMPEVPEADPAESEYSSNIAYTKVHPPKKQAAVIATELENVRDKRATENDTVTAQVTETNSTDNEKLPSPSKQIMHEAGYWTQAPEDISRMNFDDDVSADASTINQGINARAPRVNFITQQRRTLDDDDSTLSATRAEVYRNAGTAVNDRLGDRMIGPVSPGYRERFTNRDAEVDEYPRRFDRYENSRYTADAPRPYYPPYDHERDMHPEYYRVHDAFDPYMPRIPTYPDPYYEYPDRRYDLPEPRDYPPVYNNELDDRYRSYEDRYTGMPAGRIIYYDHLPEVGRGPPPVENRFRNRDWDGYYGPHYDSPLLGAYRRPPPPPPMPYDYDYRRDQMPNSGVVKVEDPNDRRPQDDRVYYDRDGNNGNGNSANATTSNPTNDQESRGYRPADHRAYY